MARGTAVHKCVEDYEAGRGYDAAYAGYLRAWAAFRRDFGFLAAPEAIEVRLYSRTLGFCGTPDSVFSGVVNVLQLTVSLYMMQVFDRVLSTRNLNTLLYLTLIAIVAPGPTSS